MLLLALLAAAPLPEVELLTFGPTSGGDPATLAVRTGPGAPLHLPVREDGVCRTATTSLAQALQSAFREDRRIDRHRLRIEPARLRRALDDAGRCERPRAWLADRLDAASDHAWSAAAAPGSASSRLDARLSSLRRFPLRFAWAELSARAELRTSTSAWSAAEGDPAALVVWAAEAGLLARSWTEHPGPPDEARVWAWPWLTLALGLGLPFGALTWAWPRRAGPATLAAIAGIGVIAWGASLGAVSGGAALAPLVALGICPAARGLGARGRLAMGALAAALAAMALAGDGFSLVLLPTAIALAIPAPTPACPRAEGAAHWAP